MIESKNTEYVYILINPSLPGKVKIGKTTTSPEQRAKEISSATGVPTPFIVAYEEIVSDCHSAEKEIHSRLESLGHRVSANREFFDCPLKEAVNIVNSICSLYPVDPHNQSYRKSIPKKLESGKLLYLEARKEFDRPGGRYAYRGDIPEYYYYNFDDNNAYLPLPNEVQEKLELSSSMGYKAAKGWLLYDEAWRYLYGYKKFQDYDLFIDKMIMSKNHNFEGAYLKLANIIGSGGTFNTRNDCVLYLPGSFNSRDWPSMQEFSTATIRKIDLLNSSKNEISDIDRNQKLLEYDSKEYKMSSLRCRIASKKAAINLLKNGVNCGVMDLYTSLIYLSHVSCGSEANLIYMETVADNKYNEYSYFGFNDVDDDLFNDLMKNRRFVNQYTKIVEYYLMVINESFYSHFENFQETRFHHKAVAFLAEFYANFRIPEIKILSDRTKEPIDKICDSFSLEITIYNGIEQVADKLYKLKKILSCQEVDDLGARSLPDLDSEQSESWADTMGSDHYGRWADIVISASSGATVIQRLRWIPPGRFMMGSPESEQGRYDDEGPCHLVVLKQGFWLFDTPCTQALWEAVMGYNISQFKSPDRPVEQVDWDDVAKFIATINEQFPGIDLVLPSEAQWEYACRAGTDTAIYTGNLEILGEHNAPALDPIAWYGGNSGKGFDLDNGWDSSNWKEKQYPQCNKSGTHPVALKRPNPWGLYDMLGNVKEQVHCHRNYDSAPGDDRIWQAGEPKDSGAHVNRGGAWLSDARDVRAASRDTLGLNMRLDFIGFRCARVQA